MGDGGGVRCCVRGVCGGGVDGVEWGGGVWEICDCARPLVGKQNYQTKIIKLEKVICVYLRMRMWQRAGILAKRSVSLTNNNT